MMTLQILDKRHSIFFFFLLAEIVVEGFFYCQMISIRKVNVCVCVPTSP